MLTDAQLAALTQIAEAAVACEAANGIPAELTTAQVALESAWLAKAPGNNACGIKEYPGCFGRQLLATTEWFTLPEVARFLAGKPGRTATLVQPIQSHIGREKYACRDWFATFPTLAGCLEKHSELLLSPRYAGPLEIFRQTGNLTAYIAAITPVYATDPNYASVLDRMAHGPNVTAAIAEARHPTVTVS